jgi:hypothetical protein
VAGANEHCKGFKVSNPWSMPFFHSLEKKFHTYVSRSS